MSRPHHAPTIRDVAEHAGVSKSLVSLALRGDPGVSDARRAAVERAVAELGYRPNRAARSLGEQRTGTVGVLLNDLRNPWFVDLLAGLTATLDTVGLAPILVDSATTRRVGGSPVDMLLRQQVDGIVVVGTTEDDAALRRAAQEIPVVLAGARRRAPRAGFPHDDDPPRCRRRRGAGRHERGERVRGGPTSPGHG